MSEVPRAVQRLLADVQEILVEEVDEKYLLAAAVGVGYYIPTRNLPRSAILAALVVAVFYARSQSVTIEDPEQVDVDQRVRAMRRLEQAIAPEAANDE